jgi:hypothetical protein
MTTLPNIVEEAQRLMEGARREQLNLRLIGGLAVWVHSPNIHKVSLQRDYPDIDFVARKNENRKLAPFFQQMGYMPDIAFNTLNGGHRQIYYDVALGRHIDVFIGDFEMCHKLPMRDRLQVHPLTVPLAELFLSKTQIVELNHKDALDLVALLLDNDLGNGDGCETAKDLPRMSEHQINLARITRLCARDWGLYTTTLINLCKLENILRNEDLGLSIAQTQVILQRIEMIRLAMIQKRKSLRWVARSRVGTRLRWYAEVEEVNR